MFLILGCKDAKSQEPHAQQHPLDAPSGSTISGRTAQAPGPTLCPRIIPPTMPLNPSPPWPCPDFAMAAAKGDSSDKGRDKGNRRKPVEEEEDNLATALKKPGFCRNRRIQGVKSGATVRAARGAELASGSQESEVVCYRPSLMVCKGNTLNVAQALSRARTSGSQESETQEAELVIYRGSLMVPEGNTRKRAQALSRRNIVTQ